MERWKVAMTIIDGRYVFGAGHGRMILRTSRTGLGRRAGHDLAVEATNWWGEVSVDAADPAASRVSVVVEVDSLAVREGTGGLKPLTDDNRAEIVATLRGDQLLHTDKYPTITLTSTGASGTAEKFVVEGDLTIVGQTRPITVDCAFIGEQRVRGTTTVVQSRWGITPYSAFLGALKLADEVGVEFDTALVPAR
jgi:polyisoprenoid-binding protein YceI